MQLLTRLPVGGETPVVTSIIRTVYWLEKVNYFISVYLEVLEVLFLRHQDQLPGQFLIALEVSLGTTMREYLEHFNCSDGDDNSS